MLTVTILNFSYHRFINAASSKSTTLKYDAKKTTLYTPKTDTIQNILTLAGSVSTSQIANLRFQSSGKLVWVGVKVGDTVKRGQALASLDREQLKKNLQTQYNNYRSQLSQFNDTQSTYKSAKDNLLVTETIQRILDRTQYSLDNSVINYEITDMAIKDSVLTSPINGVVTAIDQPLAGINITPATATITVINPENLYFEAQIDQSEVTQVKIDQPVAITLDSFPDQKIDSKINYISFTPVSGQTSTVYHLRFDLPKNIGQQFRLGMDGDVSIILNEAKDTLTIPTDAVNDDNGQRYVYLKTGNELIRRDISVGIETDSTTQVTSGISTNDQVAIIQK